MKNAKPAGNAFDAFAKTTAPTKKSASKKIAAIGVSEDVRNAVDTVISAKAKIKALKANLEEAEATVIGHVYPQQEAHARDGNYCKSFTVDGNDNSLVTVTTADKFSVPKEEAVHEELKKLLGKQFNIYLETRRKVEFTEDAMQDKGLINDMVAVAQKHGYEVPDVFSIVDSLATVEGTDENQFNLPKAKLAAFRTMVKQYKATVK